jgi:hypothetical protein
MCDTIVERPAGAEVQPDSVASPLPPEAAAQDGSAAVPPIPEEAASPASLGRTPM